MENLLDHSRAARLRGSFRLDDDPVANMNAHLRLALPRLGLAMRWREVIANSRTSRERSPNSALAFTGVRTTQDSSAGHGPKSSKAPG